ncbi:MAG: WxcM-like domain-containing protein [Gammaproteobacteria bacterium]|nr:WxcM-like domain-containing protein [Gammaproteobacteria bacterium]
MHAMRNYDQGFQGFGEAYFSKINNGIIKGWKRHREMTLNLVVPLGSVRFVIMNDDGRLKDIVISENNYKRLTVPPMLWMGFQGISETTSIVLNIANIPHQPDEIDNKELSDFSFDWAK